MRRIFNRAQNKHQNKQFRGNKSVNPIINSGRSSGKLANKVSGKSCGTVGKGKRVQFDSNLSPEEIDGLKSLKQRIAKRELVVCYTDKSKRFAIMSMQ